MINKLKKKYKTKLNHSENKKNYNIKRNNLNKTKPLLKKC